MSQKKCWNQRKTPNKHWKGSHRRLTKKESLLETMGNQESDVVRIQGLLWETWRLRSWQRSWKEKRLDKNFTLITWLDKIFYTQYQWPQALFIDLWPNDLKINSGHLLAICNVSNKFHRSRLIFPEGIDQSMDRESLGL